MSATRLTETTVEQLTEAIDHLARHVDVLRRVLDEIREDFQWALQNDRFPSPQTHDRPQTFRPSAVLDATNLVDDLTGGIEEVTHGLRHVRDRLAQDLDEQRVTAALTDTEQRSDGVPATGIVHPPAEESLHAPTVQRVLFADSEHSPVSLQISAAAIGSGKIEMPRPPDIVVRAVHEVDHSHDRLMEFVRVYGDQRGPSEWIAARADRWLERQHAARHTLMKARRIAENNGWTWPSAVQICRESSAR